MLERALHIKSKEKNNSNLLENNDVFQILLKTVSFIGKMTDFHLQRTLFHVSATKIMPFAPPPPLKIKAFLRTRQ